MIGGSPENRAHPPLAAPLFCAAIVGVEGATPMPHLALTPHTLVHPNSTAAFRIRVEGPYSLRKRGLRALKADADISAMDEDVRRPRLDEDHHTRLRYLSWSEKVDDRWVRQTVVLHPGETHPILEAKKSIAENSRLT